jgi:hypothetical protein
MTTIPRGLGGHVNEEEWVAEVAIDVTDNNGKPDKEELEEMWEAGAGDY